MTNSSANMILDELTQGASSKAIDSKLLSAVNMLGDSVVFIIEKEDHTLWASTGFYSLFPDYGNTISHKELLQELPG